jgi:hypothetical protein
VSLGWKLVIVFFAFFSILVTVITLVFRERRLGRSIRADDYEAQQAQDGRILALVFSSVIGGMLLTLLVAWLVFFR